MLKPSKSASLIVPTLVIASIAFTACSVSNKQTSQPTASPVVSMASPTADTSNEKKMVAPSQEPTATPSSNGETMMTKTATTTGQTFSQTVFYNNPAGGDLVQFTLTLDKTGVITSTDAEVKAMNQVSKGLQTKFKAEVAKTVVGKKITELKIDRIGGASLTTGAFKRFLSQVQS